MKFDVYNIANAAQKISDTLKAEYKDLTRLNIMVLGKTGAGKSTLINNMFNKKVCETGIGKPVTDKIRRYTLPDFPLAIYDTPGIELGGNMSIDRLIEEVTGEIEHGIASGNVEDAIHCIWYCVSTPSHRFEGSEVRFLKEFMDRTAKYEIPVIIVLTQSYSKRDSAELKGVIETEGLPISGIVRVLAEDYIIDDDITKTAYGLDTLAEVTNYVIPEALQRTFISIQCANLELKRERARQIVRASALTAAGIGAIPIPCSDAAVLVPEQITMLSLITVAFGIPIEKASLLGIVSGTIGTAGTTVLGKTVVSNILKLIPGVGSVVGGAISGATAAALTSALGETYIILLTRVANGEITVADLNTEMYKEEISKIFAGQLSLPRDDKGKLK